MPNPARGRVPVVIALLAGGLLIAGTIGPPLFARGVFLASDLVYSAYPWRAEVSPGDHQPADHGPVGDTVDTIFPARSEFGAATREGTFDAWNPWIAGGQSATNSGQLNPIAWPFIVLPRWFAPAMVKLLGMAAAIGFTYLFCRRLRLDRVPAILAGLAYAGSGFMVMWTNWPHPDVAAVIPGLFWATERFIQRRTVAAAVPIALALGAMLLGSFPAIVGYAVYLVLLYAAVRLLAEHRHDLRRGLLLAGGIGAGLVAGLMLVAFEVLPFVARLGDTNYDYRGQTADSNLRLVTLLTAVVPGGLGLSSRGQPYVGPYNQVEGLSFIGVTTVVLALVAFALGAPRRTPRGAFPALAWSTLVLGIATYAGGPILGLLVKLPVFSNNFIGRARSVLGLTVGVLAAFGLQALIDRTDPLTRRQWLRVGAVAAGAAAVSGVVALRSYHLLKDVGYASVARHAIVLPALVGLVVVAGLVALWRGGDRLRPLAVAVLPVALVVEALALALPLLPNESRDTVYPDEPATEFLQENLGEDRVAVEGLTYLGNAGSFWDVRIPTGHAFYTREWKDLIAAVDPLAFRASPTFPFLAGDPDVVTAPGLDRMGVTWFATTPELPPYGSQVPATLGEASCGGTGGRAAPHRSSQTSGVSHATISGQEGLRGVVVRVCEDTVLPRDATAVVTAQSGSRSVIGRTPLPPAVAAGDLVLAVPGDELAGGPDIDLTVALSDAGDVQLDLATASQGLAVDPIRPDQDGLQLAYADDLRIYRRTTGLPRIHWAGRAEVVPDRSERIERVASPELPDDTVVLSSGDPSTGAVSSAEVDVVTDDPERLEIRVDADGDGHLVVADAIQNDWVATVDGEAVDLLDADHAVVAVAVPSGQHEVVLRYEPRGRRLGLVLSAIALVALTVATVSSVPRVRRLVGR